MNVNPYYPPPNQAGILLPPVPNDPPVYGNPAYAEEYFDQLKWSRNCKCKSYLLTLHVNYSTPDNPATADKVGQAVAYKAGLSFAAVPPPGAPAWVQGLYDYLNNRFEVARGEQVILLANSQAGHGAPLYDPTLPGQWASLVAPNPTSRDDLMGFDCEL